VRSSTKKPFAFLVLLSSAAVLPAGGGDSARALNPFDTVASVAVEVFIGDSVGSVRKDRLFDGEPSREDHFNDALSKKVEAVLRSAGIDATSDGEDFLGIGIWGNQEQAASGQIVNVFLVEVTATDMSFRPDSPCESQQDLSFTSKAIGLAPPDRLEEVLEAEVLRLLGEMLPGASVLDDTNRPRVTGKRVCQNDGVGQSK
jgi:hypothetical protein